MDFSSGGKKVIERLVEAYGFTTRQALCDHLGVSKSTMATRYMRDIFPADWVLQCAMETGISIDWLVSGKGELIKNTETTLIDVETHELKNGDSVELGTHKIDPILLPRKTKSPLAILANQQIYICDREDVIISDGQWLVEIEGKLSIKKINLIPVKKVMVTGEGFSFKCGINDIKPVAKVHCVISEV
ncbi:phage repressor protein CI [Escherichia coli]|uniref:phage repressor protein CI n=1 Tax=Escherichia coli TaxID=562 RepID=UPI0005304CC0|nr:phage repressor protein CI [Escherichia coli]EAC1946461.1 phage repressor protein [Escherichia coli]EET3362233.1 phage repressor protein [Escherichia coli]EEV5885763.1 phage repressor protein [Escherichia coli]EEV8603672.1 phage repressor protein [Escherichia coli]EEW0921918.1 phage repressor protein [Escherichia coli]